MKVEIKLTSCCGAYSTYDQDGYLYCKKCFNTVPVGEGDGADLEEINDG